MATQAACPSACITGIHPRASTLSSARFGLVACVTATPAAILWHNAERFAPKHEAAAAAKRDRADLRGAVRHRRCPPSPSSGSSADPGTRDGLFYSNDIGEPHHWDLARPTRLRVRGVALLLAAAVLVAPCPAQAHVKWFCGYDTKIPPLPLRDVLTPAFLTVAAAFAALMYVAYLIDHAVERNGWLARFDRALLCCAPCIPMLVRMAVCAFFLTLWATGGTILTPELRTTNPWVPWLQLAIAAGTLFRPTLVVAAAGIIGLYVYGISTYGAFHMADYPVFLGIAAYLGFSAFKAPWLLRLRLPALYFNIAVTMMWGAIEKFGYPYWTLPLFATHSALAMGMRFDLFMSVAGFVEFSLAFFMLTGTALLRFSCLALLALMTSAIPEFGRVDAIGHSLIITGLVAMTILGHRGIQLPRVFSSGDGLARSGTMTLTYGATVTVLFGLYYGAQYLAG